MAQFKRYKSIFGEKSSSGFNSPKKSLKKESIIRSLKRTLREEEGMDAKAIDAVVDSLEDVITDVIDSHGVDNAVVDALSNTVRDINAQNEIIDDIAYMEKRIQSKYKSVFREADEEESEEEEKEEMEETKLFRSRRFKENEFMNDEFVDEFSPVGDEDEFLESEDGEEDEEKEEMEESLARRKKRIAEMKRKLSARRFHEEDEETEKSEDSEEEDDKEEVSERFKARKKSIFEKMRRIREEESEDEESEDEEMEEAINGFRSRKASRFAEEDFAGEEGDFIEDEYGSDSEEMSVDDEGHAPSDRDMEADYDDNEE